MDESGKKKKSGRVGQQGMPPADPDNARNAAAAAKKKSKSGGRGSRMPQPPPESQQDYVEVGLSSPVGSTPSPEPGDNRGAFNFEDFGEPIGVLGAGDTVELCTTAESSHSGQDPSARMSEAASVSQASGSSERASKNVRPSKGPALKTRKKPAAARRSSPKRESKTTARGGSLGSSAPKGQRKPTASGTPRMTAAQFSKTGVSGIQGLLKDLPLSESDLKELAALLPPGDMNVADDGVPEFADDAFSNKDIDFAWESFTDDMKKGRLTKEGIPKPGHSWQEKKKWMDKENKKKGSGDDDGGTAT